LPILISSRSSARRGAAVGTKFAKRFAALTTALDRGRIVDPRRLQHRLSRSPRVSVRDLRVRQSVTLLESHNERHRARSTTSVFVGTPGTAELRDILLAEARRLLGASV
jgi:hypothetical protein